MPPKSSSLMRKKSSDEGAPYTDLPNANGDEGEVLPIPILPKLKNILPVFPPAVVYD
jgi:hypothetical protein